MTTPFRVECRSLKSGSTIRISRVFQKSEEFEEWLEKWGRLVCMIHILPLEIISQEGDGEDTQIP